MRLLPQWSETTSTFLQPQPFLIPGDLPLHHASQENDGLSGAAEEARTPAGGSQAQEQILEKRSYFRMLLLLLF